MKFIAYIWKPGMKTAMLSKEDESFDEFKARVCSCYSYQMGYMVQFSEFKEIFWDKDSIKQNFSPTHLTWQLERKRQHGKTSNFKNPLMSLWKLRRNTFVSGLTQK